MSEMIVCSQCKKYHRETSRCPFCNNAVSKRVAAFASAAAGLVAVACQNPIAAVYGGPPITSDAGTTPRMEEAVVAIYGGPPTDPPDLTRAPDAAATRDAGSPAVLPRLDAGAKTAPRVFEDVPPRKNGNTMAPAYGGPPMERSPRLDSLKK